MPIFDLFGAYFFFPDHCYPSRDDKPERYLSPIIGYVKTGASIEQDIVRQLTSLFTTQRQTRDVVSFFDYFGFNFDEIERPSFQFMGG